MGNGDNKTAFVRCAEAQLKGLAERVARDPEISSLYMNWDDAKEAFYEEQEREDDVEEE